MLAILYLFVMFVLGDAIGRRFFAFVSLPHRLASAFLCGLLFSSWWTYILAYMFSNTTVPMLMGNIAFFFTAIGAILWLQRNPVKEPPKTAIDVSEASFLRWDWILAGIFLVFATWMMFRTFTTGDGNIMIGHHQFPDFGSTLSIMQSFALGHNFPTQYPHFTGERIRYHFLFYFQAGNLEYLGLNPALANNILSIFSLTSLLILVMTLGSVLFRSRIAGRIGAALFFFHGSLAFIPFLMSVTSFADLTDKLSKMTLYLKSGFPYRGEEWGVWSQNVFLNQRHLASAIAIFVLVLIYLVMLFLEHRELAAQAAEAGTEGDPNAESNADVEGAASDDEDALEGEEEESAPAVEPEAEEIEEAKEIEEDDEDDDEDEDEDEEEEEEGDDEGEDTDAEAEESEPRPAAEKRSKPKSANNTDIWAVLFKYRVLIFCGILLGLLPMWNGAIFLTAATILAMLFLLFPLRRELLALAISAAIISLPQIIYLKTGHMRPVGYSMFRWGFVIDNAGVFDVLWYTFFTFGFKWVLLAIALYFASGLQRRFLGAVCILLPLTYCFRFSEEVLANHKFINVWLTIVNIYVGYGLVKLWNMKIGPSKLPARVLAVILTLLITMGGAIDLVPIYNSYWINLKYDNDRLIEWLKSSTDPKSIFLSHRYINHQILLSGRRLFYGDPYYAWGSDYDTAEREKIVSQIFEGTDANEVFRLLKENHINYVAFDDQIRKVKQFIKNPNEDLFVKNFQLVWEDNTGEYGGLKIYKVPEDFKPGTVNNPMPAQPGEPAAQQQQQVPAGANAFQGGVGHDAGQFDRPRGVAVDSKGNIYITDTMNARVQKFGPDGKYLSAFGTLGDGDGQLKEPNGIILDKMGLIYVTDALNHKLVKYDADGNFLKEWKNPEVGFYGPRDLAWGSNGMLYIIDQGHTRIAMFDPTVGTFTMWGTSGSGDGQFNESTGICAAEKLLVVADTGNNRIQIFDLTGAFIRQWDVPEWGHDAKQFGDVAYDETTKRLYVTSGKTNEILVYDMDGKPLPGIKPTSDNKLDLPGSLTISDVDNKRRLLVVNTGGAKLSAFDLEPAKKEPEKKEPANKAKG